MDGKLNFFTEINLSKSSFKINEECSSVIIDDINMFTINVTLLKWWIYEWTAPCSSLRASSKFVSTYMHAYIMIICNPIQKFY